MDQEAFKDALNKLGEQTTGMPLTYVDVLAQFCMASALLHVGFDYTEDEFHSAFTFAITQLAPALKFQKIGAAQGLPS